MNDLRALIRELLSGEIAALRAEMLGDAQVERVRVDTGAALTQFALSVLNRAQDPGFAASLRDGRLRFAPEDAPAAPSPRTAPPAVQSQPMAAQPATLVTTAPANVPEMRKALITERDIATIAESETRLRVTRTARLTPLASDEARRRRIRIERTLA